MRERCRGFSEHGGQSARRRRGAARRSTRATRSCTASRYNFFDFVRVELVRLSSARAIRSRRSVARRHQRRRLLERSRVHLRPADDRRSGARARACSRCSTSGSGAARECLRAQLGQLAGAQQLPGPVDVDGEPDVLVQSAEDPHAAARERSRSSSPIRSARRTCCCTATNNLRGLGTDRRCRDQSLLYVRGFDPATQRYRYEVNQRFGATRPQYARRALPVTLTAMMRFDLGPTRERQTLTQQLERGRRTGDAAEGAGDHVASTYGSGGVHEPDGADPAPGGHARAHGEQADSIAALNRWYTIRLDSIWAPVAKYLAAPAGQIRRGRGVRAVSCGAPRQRGRADQAGVPTIKSMLTDEQLPQTADVRHAVPRHALPRVDPLGHRGRRTRYDDDGRRRRHGVAGRARRRWRRRHPVK